MSKNDNSQWHYVKPKRDCVHCRPFGHLSFPKGITKMNCSICEADENWMCLTCGKILCSRYKNGHMAKHNEETKHPVAVSFSDLSFWCFRCESYIQHKFLTPAYDGLHKDKFGETSRKVEQIFEDEQKVKEKAKIVAEMIMKSKHCVVYTGAGISTSAMIPDFRGPTGVWTVQKQGVCSFCPITLEEAEPTYSHKSISELFKRGFVQYVVSTNVDGLHVKSGIPTTAISELHGNAFKEKCVKCRKVYYRSIDVASADDESKITVGDFASYHYHYHGRRCEVEGCGGHLVDTIIAFGENLPSDQLELADVHSKKCDLSIVVGTKLSVTPACKLPFKGKKRDRNAKVVYINLQKSSYDHKVDIKVYNYSDMFFRYLMLELGEKSRKEM